MNTQENACYQGMRRSKLRRYARGTWKKWPGEPSGVPAHTKYPNILAELDAMIWPNIELLAEFAEVSPEIVAAVMEDNEDLTFAELRGMARILRCDPSYLAAPTLAMIDPATNKGKRRLWEAEVLLEEIGDFDCQKLCNSMLDGLRHGEPITYASWRWVCQYIRDELEYRRKTALKRRITRTERRTSA